MANPEHLAILKQGVQVWNNWRSEKPNISPDLRTADLFRFHLKGAFLLGVNLEGASLVAANLERSILWSFNVSASIIFDICSSSGGSNELSSARVY